MNTNEASLGQSTVQTYSTTEKSGFERAVFALECTARWLDNGSDPAQAAEQIRLAAAQITGCIADCDVHPADARRPAAIDKKEAVYREVGVWEPNGSKFKTYAKEDLNGKAMFVLESQPAAIDKEAVSDDDLVLVSRDLLGAACSAIDKKRDAPATLAALRAITFAPLDKGDSKPVVPSAEVVMEARRFRWIAHDHDHPEDRDAVRRITKNMSVKSYSALCRDIDAAIADSVLRENGCAAPLDREEASLLCSLSKWGCKPGGCASIGCEGGRYCFNADGARKAPADSNAVRAALAEAFMPASPSVEQDERGALTPNQFAAIRAGAAALEQIGGYSTFGPVLQAMLDRARAASTSANVAQGAVLAVSYGPMPESNGKTNWTAILHKGDLAEGHTIDRSEYPDRVRYAADCVRYLIGELKERPWILDYDADKHSGYVANVAHGAAIAIRTEKIAEIANKYALGNPRLDALLGFVNEVIIVNGAEYAKSE
jgi:hypothetical protein